MWLIVKQMIWHGLFNFSAWASMLGFQKSELSPTKIGDQSRKIFIVTGANTGIGYETCLALAKMNAIVVMACRNTEKAEGAKQRIVNLFPNAEIHTMYLDLCSFASIREFASAFKSKYGHFDVLVHNAGTMPPHGRREETDDKVEKQLGVHTVGPFLLTGLLLPIIAPEGRIVCVSSCLGALATKDFVYHDFQSECAYNKWLAYANSKAAQLLFIYELNKRLEAKGNKKKIIGVVAHPGYCDTKVMAGNIPMYQVINKIFAAKASAGALNTILAAAAPGIQASYRNYIGPRFVVFGKPTVYATAKSTWNKHAQFKLWKECVNITGENFNGL